MLFALLGGAASLSGILKQMADTMEADLKSATAEEETSIKEFNGLVQAKTKEINLRNTIPKQGL